MNIGGYVKDLNLVKANGTIINNEPDALSNCKGKVGGGDNLLTDPGNPELDLLTFSTDNIPEKATTKLLSAEEEVSRYF